MTKFKEEDLFLPIKDFFSKRGYEVNGEVKNCDIVIHNKEELIIVELKKIFTLKLLYQAIERKKITDKVYICIPKLGNKTLKNIKNIIYLLENINVGLIVVDIKKNINKVNIIINPKNIIKNKKTKAYKNILKEISERKADNNKGGISKIKITTAYREKCIHIVCIMKKYGPIKIKDLVEKYGFEKNIGNVLRNNYYNWYKREKRGVYFITEKCEKEIREDNFKEVVSFYENNIHINKI